MFTKTFKHASFFLSLACAALASQAQGVPTANGYFAENAGRLSIQAASYGAVNGAGGSLSHAASEAGASSQGHIAQTPGNISMAGQVAGYTNAVAYNTAYGNGVGSASAGGWSDASFNANAAAVIPTGYVQGSLALDGGMQNPVRNGTDAHVIATTSQDGFVNASYAGTASLTGGVAQVAIPGGAAIYGNVVGTQSADGQVQVGGVTFTGGTPAGQSAAVRFGNTGVNVDVQGSFDDPAK